MNKEEIKNAILEGDATLHAAVLDSLKGTDTHKNYVTTVTQNYFEQNIGSEHAKIYGQVDEALQAHGFDKPQGVKTSVWAAEIAKQAKEFEQKLKDLEGKSPEDVQKQLNSLKEKHQKELSQITEASTSKISELSKQIEALQGEKVQTKRGNAINSVVSQFTINKGLPEGLVKNQISYVKQQLLANATVDADGNTIWNKPDGTPYKDSTNGLVNATLEDILSVELKDIIHSQTAGGGAPNTGGENTNSSVMTNGTIRFTKQPESRLEFTNLLTEATRKQGLIRGSEDYNKVVDECMTHYNFMKLKEK
jgi:archaellum component FlaC